MDNETEKENPLSHNSMAQKLKCSRQSIGDIINKDLNKKLRKKTKVHSLNAKQMNQRKTVTRRLYEKYLAKNKYKYVVTLDEAWIYLSNTCGQRSIYYVRRGEMDEKTL